MKMRKIKTKKNLNNYVNMNLIDTMPEWLRGLPAKQICYAFVGSNPAGID